MDQKEPHVLNTNYVTALCPGGVYIHLGEIGVAHSYFWREPAPPAVEGFRQETVPEWRKKRVPGTGDWDAATAWQWKKAAYGKGRNTR